MPLSFTHVCQICYFEKNECEIRFIRKYVPVTICDNGTYHSIVGARDSVR